MLQTSEIRRAVGQVHRTSRDFQEYRTSFGNLSAANVPSDRLPNSLTALAQATGLHAPAVSTVPMQEFFLATTVDPFVHHTLEPREYLSSELMSNYWRDRIVSGAGATPAVIETGIHWTIGRGITVPTHDAATPVGDPVNREEPAQAPPRNFELTLSSNLAQFGQDPSLEAGIDPALAVHSLPLSVFISYIRSGPRDPSVRPPLPIHEIHDTAALLDHLAGTGQREFAQPWEYATISDAPNKPDPVDVFSHIPPQLEALFQEIEELPEDWNSYGAARISRWSITEARSITDEGMGLGLPVPAVSPASGASVGIEWQTSNADLIIDVDPQQGITYLIVDRASGIEIEGELNAGNRSEVLRKVIGL